MAFPSRAIFGLGTHLRIGDGNVPESFTKVAEVRTISGPTLTTDILDVTSHCSQGGVREFKGGLIDPGELTFTLNFQPGEPTHGVKNGLQRDQLAKTVRNFELAFPPGIGFVWEFVGIITGFPLTFPIDEVITADVTIKITGLPNFEKVTPPGF